MPKGFDLARLAVSGAGAAFLAWWAFPRAIEDWRFQLAGLANPWLGRPAPGATIILGLIVSALAIVIALDGRRRGHVVPSILLAPLAAGWLAYAAGTGVILASGGQQDYPGQMDYTFSGAIDHAETLDATCRTPVGERTVLAVVEPDVRSKVAVGGLPIINLRHPATGERIDGGDFQRFEMNERDGTVLPPFSIPSLGDRPLPYMEVIIGPDQIEREPPIGMMDAYDYVLESVEDAGMSGSAVLRATRWEVLDGGEVGWVNLRIPDDPWPESFTLSVAWSCAA